MHSYARLLWLFYNVLFIFFLAFYLFFLLCNCFINNIVFLDTYFLFLLKLIFISSDNKQQGKKQKYKM